MADPLQHPPLQVPHEFREQWQSIVDTMARLIGVPAGLIMRKNEPDIEVYVTSDTAGNPYDVGASEHLWGSGLYCETVLKTRERLIVPNALEDADWRDNPDVELNMISYLGYPILLPDGNSFGTICVLDSKGRPYTDDQIALVAHMRDLIQSHLGLVYMNQELRSEHRQLADYIAELKTLRGILPICAHCKKIRDEKEYWHTLESYIQQHSEASFTHGLCPSCVELYYPFEGDQAD